jgi:hypothetical protein
MADRDEHTRKVQAEAQKRIKQSEDRWSEHMAKLKEDSAALRMHDVQLGVL